MSFSSLLASLGAARRHKVRGKPARFRPAIEPLGERCLPSAGLSATLAPAAAGAALVADSGPGQDQPFHLSGAGVFTPVSPTDATFTASGTATALGHWTNYGEVHFDGDHVTGVAVFTSANGDVLVARVEGTIASSTFTFVSSATLADGTVVRSTGRFEGVSGSAQLIALGFPNFTFALDGHIAYAASNRPGQVSNADHT